MEPTDECRLVCVTVFRTAADMGYKCCVHECPTGRSKKEEDEKPEVEDERSGKSVAVFQFPDEHKDLDRRMRWIRFVNRKDFVVTKYTRICEKHFEKQYVRIGAVRNTLIHEKLPVPTIQIYSNDIPPSLLPTPSPPSKKTTDRA